MTNKISIHNIALFCKEYRMYVLRITLSEMGELCNINIKTLSSFENGNSTNLEHLICYYELGNKKERKFFSDGLFKRS